MGDLVGWLVGWLLEDDKQWWLGSLNRLQRSYGLHGKYAHHKIDEGECVEGRVDAALLQFLGLWPDTLCVWLKQVLSANSP